MYNVGVIDEATLNAVRAGLDCRIEHLEDEIARLEAQTDPFYWPHDPYDTEAAQRALIWNNAALLETMNARDRFSESSLSEFWDHPADATYQGWTEGELVAGFGK